MFTNESTENLLENFENELDLLEEVVVVKSDVKKNDVTIELGEPQAPVPSKRAFQPSPDIRPVPATRQKVQSMLSMGKNDKNDENEIIQLSSISSDLMKSSQSQSSSSTSAAAIIKNSSQDSSLNSKKQNTVIVVNEKKKTPNKISVQVYHEPHQVEEPEESAFVVVSHGKWAKNKITVAEVVQEDDTESEPPIPTKRAIKTKTPVKQEVQFISENKKVKKLVKKAVPPSSPSTGSSKLSSSEVSSSEDTPEKKKKSKSKIRKKEKTKKRKTKRKLSSEDDEEGSVTSRTEESVSETQLKDPVAIDDNRSIGKCQWSSDFINS